VTGIYLGFFRTLCESQGRNPENMIYQGYESRGFVPFTQFSDRKDFQP
jgi:hypothetical protein